MADDSGRGSRGKLAESMDAFCAKCRQAGLKVTPQRMAVYKVLVEFNEQQLPVDTVERNRDQVRQKQQVQDS